MLAASGPAGGQVDLVLGIAMFFIMFSVSLFPMIAGWIDTALTPGGVARYGGGWRFAAGALAETVFSMLLAPVSALAVTVFMGGLLMGRTITWSGQQRDLTRVSWRQALRTMWPQTLLGAGLAAVLAAEAPAALPWAAPALTGLLFAAPMAVLTASPRFGAWMARVGLCATPEELAPPAVLNAGEMPDPPDLTSRAA
jgi:membrane glycosyltransferase